ncbi:MAG: hypothetical protein C4295_10580 [Candidatus Fervidibacterota bacterium]
MVLVERLRRFWRKPLRDKVWSLRAHLAPWLPLPMRLEFGAWWLVWYDSTSHRIYQRSYEPNTQAFLKGFLKTGMTVLDIGAHHGFYTLLAARCVGLVGKVTAFEPSPRERRRLIWHVRLNRCPQVLVEPFALSDREGTMELYLTQDNSANSLSPPKISPIVGKVTVKVTTLDAYCQRNRIERVDLVKMDAEGAELLILQGAKKLLQGKLRPVIITEVNPQTAVRFGYSVDDLKAFLTELKFHCVAVPGEENVIAAPTERMEEVAVITERCWRT